MKISAVGIMLVLVASVSFAQTENHFSIGLAHTSISQTQTQASSDYTETYRGFGVNIAAFTGSQVGIYSGATLVLIREFEAQFGSQSQTFDDLSSFDST